MKTLKELLEVKLIPEIFDQCRAAKTSDEVKAIISKNQSPAIWQVMAYAFHPEVVFDVPVPAYKPDPNPAGLSPNSLFMEASRIYVFTTKRSDVAIKKRQQILLNILESVHPTEAKVLVDLIKNKAVNVPLLTVELLNSIRPNFLNTFVRK